MIEPRRLLSASAGAGKTFQLGGHFTNLLLEGVEPGRILATTFTRKAAGEILERVLGGLAFAADGGDALRDLRLATGREELTSQECADCLERLVPSLPRVQVRTLDSWFGHLARLFAFELGLPQDWSISSEVEARAVRTRALGKQLAAANMGDFFTLLREIAKRASARSVHKTLIEIVAQARSTYLESDEAAWQSVRAPEGMGDEELQATIEGLPHEFPCPNNKKGEEDKRWRKAVNKLHAELVAGNWEALSSGGLMGALETGAFYKVDLEPEQRAILEPIREHVAHELVQRVVDRTQAMYSFLNDYEEHYRALTFDRGQLRFEDVPSLLDPRGEVGPPDDLWFRLDGRIDHLLLDEFQDTAPVQWRVLESLASEIISQADEGRSFFCVGDVKQSIYGFRSAEPRILEQLPNALPGLKPEPLDRNFRSSPVVLATVDQVFQGLDQAPVIQSKEFARGAVARWTSRYNEHIPGKPDMLGYAALWEAPASGEKDSAAQRQRAALELAAERVADLYRAHADISIGVLFRRRKHIPTFQALLNERGVPSSRATGNPLTDSVAVLAGLSLLRLADHPLDSVATFHAASSRLGQALGLAPDERAAPELARSLRKRLASQGLVAVLRAFASDVGELYDAWNVRRFQQLVQLADSQGDSGAAGRPAAFVEFVREHGVEDPTRNRVRCMTIHGSKGLEFDAVVLPELDTELGQDRSALLTRRSNVFEAFDVVSSTTKQEVAKLSPELETLKLEGRAREMEESCSMLYVALTRARRRLDMIVPPAASRLTPAQLLREVLDAPDEAEDGLLWLAPGSTEDCFPGQEQAEPDPAVELQQGLGLGAATSPRLQPVRHASTEAQTPVTLEELLSPVRAQARRVGTLVHRLLEQVAWLEDFDLDEAQLEGCLRQVEPGVETRQQALRLFLEGLQHDEIRSLLTRPAGEVEVRAEWPFSVTLSGGETWTGAIDRLVLTHEGGRVTGATVVDWKTDADGAAGDHAAQLARYAQVVAQTFGVAPERIERRVAYLVSGVVD